MGLNEKQLSRIRAIAHAVVAHANEESTSGFVVAVRRTETGVRIRVTPGGGPLSSEPLLELGDLADAIRNELRLEKNAIGDSIWGTGESVFQSGNHPVFEFDAWLLSSVG